MTIEIISHTDLRVGDRIDADYGAGLVAVVLRGAEETTETVPALFGRPVWRYWCREEGGEREGFMSYGDGGVARVIR
jgi:hypothetical protein